jgi:Xaa-Pro dipeptidase
MNIGAMVITHHIDIYYFTGTMQNGLLFVPVIGPPLFYVKRSIDRAISETTVSVEPLESFKTLGARLAKSMPLIMERCNIGLTYDTITVELFDKLKSILPLANWVNASKLIRTLRMVKDEHELNCIRRAARVVDIALFETLPMLKAGMTEIELLAEIEYNLRKHGHLGLIRVRAMNMEIVTGIAASGAAAAKPSAFDGPAGGEGLHPAFPKGSGWNIIQNNEPILLDIGCNIDGYVIDQTRTAVIGELAEDLQRAYDTSENILRAIELHLNPGTVCEDLYNLSLDMARMAGFSDHYMGYKQNAVKFVGHGFGLEIDEWPVLARGVLTYLEPGMVIAIEPKFTFPGRGVVGIENSYLITTGGHEKLTISREGVWKLG